MTRRLGHSQEIVRRIIQKAKRSPKRIVFPEGTEPKILRACQVIIDERIATPILLGDREKINEISLGLHLDLRDAVIIDPKKFEGIEHYISVFHELRWRKGVTWQEAEFLLRNNTTYLAAMMVRMGDADGLVGGINQHYPNTINRP